MTKAEKQKWVEIRSRVKDGLEDKGTLLKQDLIKTWKLHYKVFGHPKHKPPINCCVNKNLETWLNMAKNLNKDYLKKAT
jgi:hypothetical protein